MDFDHGGDEVDLTECGISPEMGTIFEARFLCGIYFRKGRAHDHGVSYPATQGVYAFTKSAAQNEKYGAGIVERLLYPLSLLFQWDASGLQSDVEIRLVALDEFSDGFRVTVA